MSFKDLLGYLLLFYICLTLALTLFASSCSTAPPVEPKTGNTSIEELKNLSSQTANLQIPDFSSFTSVQDKKQAFIGFFQPIIEKFNHIELARRDQVYQLQNQLTQERSLDLQSQEVLQYLKQLYRIDESLDTQSALSELKHRVNIIPGSMILAQAASESAWGTSRFAQKANNFFGQWCFTKGCGIVPARRNQGATHEIAKFDNAEDSIRAYFHNLNTYRPYEEFRGLRYQLSNDLKSLNGLDLVEGLQSYSERGQDYIDDLKSIIRYNKFDQLFGEG